MRTRIFPNITLKINFLINVKKHTKFSLKNSIKFKNIFFQFFYIKKKHETGHILNSHYYIVVKNVLHNRCMLLSENGRTILGKYTQKHMRLSNNWFKLVTFIILYLHHIKCWYSYLLYNVNDNLTFYRMKLFWLDFDLKKLKNWLYCDPEGC